jgi:hypothetical protein
MDMGVQNKTNIVEQKTRQRWLYLSTQMSFSSVGWLSFCIFWGGKGVRGGSLGPHHEGLVTPHLTHGSMADNKIICLE